MNQQFIDENIFLLKRSLIDIKVKLSEEFLNDDVSFTIGDQFHLKNTPLYLILEAHVKNRENEDDYGLCLTITFQYYNPESEEIVVTDNEIYIVADLTRGDGHLISSFGVKMIKLDTMNYIDSIKDIRNDLLKYLQNQSLEIATILRKEYLK